MGMKGVWAIPVMFGILFIGSLGLTPNAYAASGTIAFINPAGNIGFIDSSDESVKGFYHFFIPDDLLDPDMSLAIGVTVGFDVEPENGRHATNLRACVGCGF